MAVKKKATGAGAASRPAKKSGSAATRRRVAGGPVPHVEIPRDVNDATLRIGGKDLDLTNLDKVFWPEEGYTKRDLLQYYADVAHVILPHLRDRAITMKRYPHGITGEFFFMKRAPEHRPDWVETCSIMHKSKSLIAFPLAQDVPSLLWLINLGCIDLNPWYSRCDDVHRPDFLHFDLDPVAPAPFARVREVALLIRDALAKLGAAEVHLLRVEEPAESLRRSVWAMAPLTTRASTKSSSDRLRYQMAGSKRHWRAAWIAARSKARSRVPLRSTTCTSIGRPSVPTTMFRTTSPSLPLRSAARG